MHVRGKPERCSRKGCKGTHLSVDEALGQLGMLVLHDCYIKAVFLERV